MTQVSEQEFLVKLYEIVYKLSTLAKTQVYRFKKIWGDYLNPLNDNPHLVRQIPLDKEKFLNDIVYRIEILKIVELSLVDGFYSIKCLLQTLYSSYFNDSTLLKKDYSEPDQLILKYLAAKEILGNLIQYNQMDHDTVPLKYNIMARNYLMLKLQGQTDMEVLESLNKLNISLNLEELNKIMKDIEKDGFIAIHKEGNRFSYKIAKELELSDVGKKKFNQTLRPLLDWATEFWRSYYNIRELNVTVSEETRYRDFLLKLLTKSATQGFAAADYVFKNLIKYYEKIKEDM